MHRYLFGRISQDTRQREHRTRALVHVIAAIEREAAAAGLGPTTRQDVSGWTVVVASDGSEIARVGVTVGLGDPRVTALRPDGSYWYAGCLEARRIAG